MVGVAPWLDEDEGVVAVAVVVAVVVVVEEGEEGEGVEDVVRGAIKGGGASGYSSAGGGAWGSK